LENGEEEAVTEREFIQGELVSGDDIERVTRERRRTHELRRVSWDQVEEVEREGYSIRREFQYGAQMVKPKDCGRQLEDEIWLLLWRFGFSELNGLGPLFIEVSRRSGAREDSRVQVDVLGKADRNVFVVECKSAEKPSKRSLRETITKFTHYRSRIVSAVRKHYADSKIKVSFIIATRNIRWARSDEREARDSKIHVWKEKDIDYLKELAKLYDLIGDAARYQLYGIMFGDAKIKVLEEQEVPAIKGKIGRVTYFSFLATPEQLLKISYVHRRAGTGGARSVKEVREAYQRMLKPRKLREIDKFISRGEFFPNSIIINFGRPPRFDVKASEGIDFQYGMLTLPNCYGSAWIIDGQHRLYGYAKNPRRLTAPIPVVAFDRLPVSKQAKLFVDINEKQTRVGANLLWDLAGDIYEDSEDEDQIEAYIISHVAKNLDSMSNSPLKAHIFIPSVGKRSPTRNVTMTTVCGSIKRNKLIGPKMLGPIPVEGRDEFARFVAERVAAYLRGVEALYEEDWGKGDDGYLRSNNGIAALFIILRQVLGYLNNRGQERLYTGTDTANFQEEVSVLLSPAMRYLRQQQLSDEFRQRRGVAGQTDSAQDLCMEIRTEFTDFPLPKPLEKAPGELEEAPVEHATVERLIVDTELKVREFILQTLKEIHGDKWYVRGVPGGVKADIEDTVEKECRKRPWLRDEIAARPEIRLQYSTLGHLKDIIVYGENWPQFEVVFETKGILQSRFDDYMDLRNCLRGHPREVDDALLHSGHGAILWIRKCLRL